MKIRILALTIFTLFALKTINAEAAFMTYTDQANWEAALIDPTLLEDFEGELINGARGLNAAVTYTSPNGVMFDFPGGGRFGFPKIVAPGGDTWELDFLVQTSPGVKTTIMTLPSAVIAWGADFDNPANPFGSNVGAVDSAVATILGEPFDLSNFFSLDPNAEGFFGVVSTMGPFDTVTFTGKGGAQGVGYDNIRVGTEPVPEPATVALLGIGLVGLVGGAARRKFKKKELVKH
jgi:hypothetical protein